MGWHSIIGRRKKCKYCPGVCGWRPPRCETDPPSLACRPWTRILGIDIDAEPECVRADVVTYGRAAADLLDLPFPESAVEVLAGHADPAYGMPHDATIEAIKLAGRLEALALDPVYSGKGLAGLIALVRQQSWRPDDDVVFLHSGGAPAFFTYRECLDL